MITKVSDLVLRISPNFFSEREREREREKKRVCHDEVFSVLEFVGDYEESKLFFFFFFGKTRLRLCMQLGIYNEIPG